MALDRELADLARAVKGTRNDSLNRAAFNLGQLVGTGLLDGQLVTSQLEQVGVELGLDVTETRRTVASGLAAGLAHPRDLQSLHRGSPGRQPASRVLSRRR